MVKKKVMGSIRVPSAKAEDKPATRRMLKEVRAELKIDIESVKTELRQEIKNLETELR